MSLRRLPSASSEGTPRQDDELGRPQPGVGVVEPAGAHRVVAVGRAGRVLATALGVDQLEHRAEVVVVADRLRRDADRSSANPTNVTRGRVRPAVGGQREPERDHDVAGHGEVATDADDPRHRLDVDQGLHVVAAPPSATMPGKGLSGLGLADAARVRPHAASARCGRPASPRQGEPSRTRDSARERQREAVRAEHSAGGGGHACPLGQRLAEAAQHLVEEDGRRLVGRAAQVELVVERLAAARVGPTVPAAPAAQAEQQPGGQQRPAG